MLESHSDRDQNLDTPIFEEDWESLQFTEIPTIEDQIIQSDIHRNTRTNLPRLSGFT
jgi:hypothetical protein